METRSGNCCWRPSSSTAWRTTNSSKTTPGDTGSPRGGASDWSARWKCCGGGAAGRQPDPGPRRLAYDAGRGGGLSAPSPQRERAGGRCRAEGDGSSAGSGPHCLTGETRGGGASASSRRHRNRSARSRRERGGSSPPLSPQGTDALAAGIRLAPPGDA